MDDSLIYKKLFKQICDGYSKIETEFGTAFIRHLNLTEQTILEENKTFYLEKAKTNGLPTVEEALFNLCEEGYWSKEEENKIIQEEIFVKKLLEQKKNTYLKSQIDNFNNQVDDSLKRINELKNKRNSFLGNTCENYADQRVTEEFIKHTLYKDEKMQNLFFTDDQFDEINVSQLSNLVGFYNSINKSFTDLNIQKLVLQDFFGYYMSFSEDPIHFYGLPVVKLTFNQLRTLIYARYFKNVLSNNDKIPEEYKKDPEKIIDYVSANQKAKQAMESSKDGQAQSIVGATKEDYEYLNMNKGNTKALSLSEEAKKKGGSLDMKDLMNLMGV